MGETGLWHGIYGNGIHTIKSQTLPARRSSNDGKRKNRRENHKKSTRQLREIYLHVHEREKQYRNTSDYSIQSEPKKGTKTGPDTAYMQQHVAMREAGIKDPDPRKKLLEDLSQLIVD